MRVWIFIVLCLALYGATAYGGDKDNRNGAKAFLDAAVGLIPKIGGPVSKGRTIGQGMNDMAIPGRKEFENFDQNDPAFKAWVKSKEEQRAKDERDRKQREEAIRNYSNQGGMQKTIVPDYAKGQNRLKEIISAPNRDADASGRSGQEPAGTISAGKGESPAKRAPEPNTISNGGKSADLLGDLLKKRDGEKR